MQVWRIVRSRFVQSAFSGEGTRLYPGRWNPAGVPVVYTATSLPMAALEVFVHLQPRVEPRDLVVVSAGIPVSAEEFTARKRQVQDILPPNWNARTGEAAQRYGAQWMRSGASFFLPVPSVVIRGEWNLLLNPEHPDARSIRVGPAEAFTFDERTFL